MVGQMIFKTNFFRENFFLNLFMEFMDLPTKWLYWEQVLCESTADAYC